jgi:hypothetical protein
VPSAPGAVTPGEVGPPSGCRRSRDVRTPAGPVVALSASSGPPWAVRPTGRADLQQPGVRCPGVRCSVHPGVRPDRLWCPRRCRRPVRAALDPGVARWRAAPAGRSESTCPGGLWAAWSPARIGPDGKGWRGGCRCLLAGGSTVARPPLGRRPGGGATLAQRADTGAGPGPGCPAGGGEHGTEQVLTGPAGRPRRSPAWCPTMGLDQEVVTTLGGRWARVVRWRPVPEGLLGSVGEQPAAAARPQRVRGAVR